jgi:hypothetical protein
MLLSLDVTFSEKGAEKTLGVRGTKKMMVAKTGRREALQVVLLTKCK